MIILHLHSVIKSAASSRMLHLHPHLFIIYILFIVLFIFCLAVYLCFYSNKHFIHKEVDHYICACMK